MLILNYILNHIIFLKVESKTNQKIKDLLSEDSVDSSTRLVLVNALYFKVNLFSLSIFIEFINIFIFEIHNGQARRVVNC